MQIQHVNVKLLLEKADGFDFEPLVPIFHGWIENQLENQANGELLLDVADYRHVDAGPGVILIGYEGDYCVDDADHKLGVRYNRKAPLEGSNQDRLAQAARAAMTACQRLEGDSRLDGKLRFNGRDIEIFINDRLLAPNDSATREGVARDLDDFSRKLFGDGVVSGPYAADPRRLFGVSLKASEPVSIADLLERLS